MNLQMPFAVGIVLSLVVAVFARRVRLDRGGAFYSTVLIVVASYYVLFAAMSGSTPVLVGELIVMAGFVAAATVGFKSSAWILAGGLAAHGLFDAVHGRLINNPGVPDWWPAFCGAYDLGAAVWLAWIQLASQRARVSRLVAGRRHHQLHALALRLR